MHTRPCLVGHQGVESRPGCKPIKTRSRVFLLREPSTLRPLAYHRLSESQVAAAAVTWLEAPIAAKPREVGTELIHGTLAVDILDTSLT